jgi:hypothetical protein
MVLLTEVFRQAAESRIIVNVHRINQGLMSRHFVCSSAVQPVAPYDF